MSGHSAEKGSGLCTCPEPNRPTGREPEPLAPWECLTCGGYACEYADKGRKKCPASLCDCFIDQFPDSPRDVHPEVFVIGGVVDNPPSFDRDEWASNVRWDNSVAPGGYVCATCGVPVESEPCGEHGTPEEIRHCDGCGADYNAFEESHVGHEEQS